MIAPAEDYSFGGDRQCGPIISLLMTESPLRARVGSLLFQAAIVSRVNGVVCWLIVTEGCVLQ